MINSENILKIAENKTRILIINISYNIIYDTISNILKKNNNEILVVNRILTKYKYNTCTIENNDFIIWEININNIFNYDLNYYPNIIMITKSDELSFNINKKKFLNRINSIINNICEGAITIYHESDITTNYILNNLKIYHKKILFKNMDYHKDLKKIYNQFILENLDGIKKLIYNFNIDENEFYETIYT